MTDVSKIAEYQDEINEAKTPGTFNLVDTIQGTAYPEEQAIVFTNVRAVYEYGALREQINNFEIIHEDDRTLGGYGEHQEEYDALLAARDEAYQKARASGLTFHLKGLSPTLVDAVAKEKRAKAKTAYEGWSEEDKSEAIIFDIEDELIARATQRVVNAEGAVNTDVTAPVVRHMRDTLPETEFTKIRFALNEVQFKAVLFDEEIDAGFPG